MSSVLHRSAMAPRACRQLDVALLNSLYPPLAVGGAEKVVQYLAEALARSRHRVSVITLTPEGEGRVDRLDGVTVIRLPTDVPWPFGTSPRSVAGRIRTKLKDHHSARMYARVRAVLSELRPDIVHTNSLMGFSAAAWDAAASLDIPIVHTAHDWYLPCMRSTMLRSGRRCARQCASCFVYSRRRKSASARVDAFIGVSNFVRQTHLNCGFFASVGLTTVIHNPSPPRRPPPFPNSHAREPLRLGFLGRIDAAKGIEGLLAALRPTGGEFRLYVGGTGDAALVERLKTRYADDRFVWLGRVEPSDFFGRIDVLVVPSVWNEPYGLVIGEAHSHGIPVIASRRGGIPEIVQDGITGLLYDPDHPAELAGIVNRMAVDRSIVGAMSAAIMGRRTGPDIDDWARAYASVYMTVAGHRGRALRPGPDAAAPLSLRLEPGARP